MSSDSEKGLTQDLRTGLVLFDDDDDFQMRRLSSSTLV